jgi:AcrR family transcriptional regulator
MATKRLGTGIRRDQIAEAALEIVRSKGTRGLSVAAVAKKVGIVPSAVYRHFRNKDDIVTAVLQLIQSRLNANFQAVKHQEIDALDKLHRLLHHHIELIAGNNAIPRIVFSEEVLGGMPEKQAELYAIIQDVLSHVAAIVGDAQATGSVRKDLSPEDVAVAFFGMIQPAAIIWHLSGGAFDLKHHAESAWRLFYDAVRVRGEP